MKRTLAMLLSLMMLVPMLARAEAPDTVTFQDSTGRAVALPATVTKVAASGPLAQIALFALCPDKLVGVAEPWGADALAFLPERYRSLPMLGQLYGSKGELNLESLLLSGAQVVIDVGKTRDDAAADLDALQQQTGVPFVHIHASLDAMGDAYRKLGALVGMPAEAEALAAYCERVYADALALSRRVEKTRLLYLTGDKGLNVIARGSYHAELIDLLGDNVAQIDEPTSKGTGNEVDMEQLLLWDPDVILFAPDSVYDSVGSDEIWQQLSAIRNHAYYEVPIGPYIWIGFPPSVQRYLGVLWMSKLLYPQEAPYDLYEAVAEYFELFYHIELTREEYDALVKNSVGAR